MRNVYPSAPAPAVAQTGTSSALRGRLVSISLLLVTFLLIGAGVYALQVASASGLAAGYPMPHVTIDTSNIPGSVSVNQQVTFTASSPGRNLTYAWDFGDQSGTEQGQTVSHAYSNFNESNNFLYTVTVTVVDILGRSSTDTTTVKVVPPPPVAQFTYMEQYSYEEYFDASASTYSTQNVTYNWDFGDSSTDSPTSNYDYHSYSGPGTYTVTLTVTDGAGQSNTATQQVTVN